MGKVNDALAKFGITKDSLVSELAIPPGKPVLAPKWNADNIKPHTYHQADLLFLPFEKKYKDPRYCLVVVDIHTKQVQARALKDKKPASVLRELKSIYAKSGKRTLPRPGVLHIDAGNEFDKTVKKWLRSQLILPRVAAPARHGQQSIVEKMNALIGKTVLTLQMNEELRTGRLHTGWADFLPTIIDSLNEHTSGSKKKPIVKSRPKLPLCKGKECKLLPIGTTVRVALDRPISGASGRVEPNPKGVFRAGDVRWSIKPYKIENILLLPNWPARYVVSGHDSNTFAPHQVKEYKGGKIQPLAKPKRLSAALRRKKAELEKKYSGKRVLVAKRRGKKSHEFGTIGEAARDPSMKTKRNTNEWGMYVSYDDDGEPLPLLQPLADVIDAYEEAQDVLATKDRP